MSNTNNSSLDLDEILKQKDFMKQLLQKIAGLVRLSNTMPPNEELKFYMNNEQLKKKQKTINTKILQLIKKVATFVQYEHADSIDLNHFAFIINMNDQLFENIDTSLDKIKKVNNITESSLFDPAKTTVTGRNPIRPGGFGEEITGEDIIALATKEKPQNHFKDCIDSSYQYPFIPVIKNKLNAEVPLDDVIQQAQQESIESFFKDVTNPQSYEFPHPYAYEIENFTYTEQQLQTENLTVQEPISLKEELVYVDNEAIFDEMVEALKQCSEIAIDLEHHSYRSFNGITCLMQISSRTKDYIVDVFDLWKSMNKLNVVFTDKNIVKVFHGADMDIQWLQRDFGLYIVNLFDTGQAARTLSMPSYALAYLLQSISKVQTDKKYQQADWRIRPLPKEMISYARFDTHYLLSIYDTLRLQLISKAIQQGINPTQLIETVLSKSRTVCLKKYAKPILEDERYHSILQNQRLIYSDRKFRILKRLLEWRFTMASRYDENSTYVLANDTLFNIVNRLPQTLKELTASNLKLSYVCQYHASEIIEIIKTEVESQEKGTSASKEEVKKDNEMEIEEQNYNLKTSNITYSYLSTMQTENIEEEEVSFKFETFDVQVGQYSNSSNSNSFSFLEDHLESSSSTQGVNKIDNEVQEKLQKINSSFFYADPVDFYCEKYPFIQEAYDLAKLQEEEIMKKRNDLIYIQSKNPFEGENEGEGNNEEENRDEYLEFIKEKGPSSKPKEVDQIEVPDLPLSYEDQFKTNLKKRKYNFGKTQQNQNQDDEEEEGENGEKINKKRQVIGQKSTFDRLIEQEFRDSDSEDSDDEDNDNQDGEKKKKKKKRVVSEEEKQKIQEQFDQFANKIKTQIGKDPKFKSGINATKNYNANNNNRRGGNQKNNRFVNKFNKNGF